MPACMLFCINCSHSGGICGGQFKPGRGLDHSRRVVACSGVSLTSGGRELRQAVLILSMAGLRRVWLWGILLEAGQTPAGRWRWGMLVLSILVRATGRLLHLRKWEGKVHPGVVAVVCHCGRSAARRWKELWAHFSASRKKLACRCLKETAI